MSDETVTPLSQFVPQYGVRSVKKNSLMNSSDFDFNDTPSAYDPMVTAEFATNPTMYYPKIMGIVDESQSRLKPRAKKPKVKYTYNYRRYISGLVRSGLKKRRPLRGEEYELPARYSSSAPVVAIKGGVTMTDSDKDDIAHRIASYMSEVSHTDEEAKREEDFRYRMKRYRDEDEMARRVTGSYGAGRGTAFISSGAYLNPTYGGRVRDYTP